VPEADGHTGQADRVSTLELFFDLVFVFTITQLTAVLSDDPTLRGLLRVVLMLGVIFWMYGGYAWLTNAVALDRAARRLVLLGGMAGFLVLALTVPQAFAGGDLAFGLAYLVVVSIHAGLYSRTSVTHTVRALFRLAPFNLASALLVLGAVVAGGTAGYLLWVAAFALEWVTPLVTGIGGFRVAPAHFVERHGLLVIVALGESIVAIGIGASGLPVDLALISVAVLGLLLAACLWWAYFGGDDTRAEQALAAVPEDRRAAVAVLAFGYCSGSSPWPPGSRTPSATPSTPSTWPTPCCWPAGWPSSWPATWPSAGPCASAPGGCGPPPPSSPWPPSRSAWPPRPSPSWPPSASSWAARWPPSPPRPGRAAAGAEAP
jgi:low temperature requirement protein LtrA